MQQRQQGRQRRLGRTMLVLGVLIAIAVIGGSLVRRMADEPSGGIPPAESRDEDVPSLVTHPGLGESVDVDVERIIDGDTLEVTSASTELTVRLFGVDAPERDEQCHDEASERLAALAGPRVRLVPDERLTDPFDRELRYLFTPDGASIDAVLIAEGLATAWPDDGLLRDELVALEVEARDSGTGCLWSDG